MIYLPGMGTQFITTIIFFLIVTVIGYLGLRVHFQEGKIYRLEASLKECELATEGMQSNNEFLKENIRILKEHQEKKNKRRPPVIIDGDLKIENLFSGEPR